MRYTSLWSIMVLILGLGLMVLPSQVQAQYWCGPGIPYHTYHHYEYYGPGPGWGPHAYHYDVYPYYRGYTYTHPPVYGFSYGRHGHRDHFGISVPGFSFFYND